MKNPDAYASGFFRFGTDRSAFRAGLFLSLDRIGNGNRLLRNDLFERKQLLMDQLTEEEREVYRRYYEEDLSLKDTAEALNTSVDSVRGSLRRIKNKLKRIMVTILDNP